MDTSLESVLEGSQTTSTRQDLSFDDNILDGSASCRNKKIKEGPKSKTGAR